MSMSYELPLDQRSMVLDDHRNGFYRRALEQVIGPESVVTECVKVRIGGFVSKSNES